MKKIVNVFIISFLLLMFATSNVLAAEEDKLDIECEGFIVMEQSSGRVLSEKNADEPMYPASLTKVATAIYAIENGNLEDIVTVSERARNADGTRVYLEEGEKVPLKKLIQGLLINSGNDAGIAIAEHMGGSVEEFANRLNVYLKEIGVDNTHFKNPHGLFDLEHVTTAKDLAKITQYAMKNEVFRTIFGTEELKWEGQAWNTTLFTHHKLMREKPYEGVTGGKTGYVDESGNTLITTAEREDMSVIVVVLKAQSQHVAYSDTVELLDFAFNEYDMIDIPSGKEYKQNNHTYVTNQNYSLPISEDEQITEKVTGDGSLEVTIPNEDFIAILPLKDETKEVVQISPEEEIQSSTKTIDQSPIKEENNPLNSLSLIIIATLTLSGAIAIYLYRRKKRQRDRFRVPNDF